MVYNFKQVKVLIVESSVPMCGLIKGALGAFGVPDSAIDSAYSVREAFDKFCQVQHDLIIVDWLQSPDRGIELTQMIRRRKVSPNAFVPIIMTAGAGHLQRVLMARDAGISEYLVKPFSAKSLAERISRVIEKPKPFVFSDIYVGPDRRVRAENHAGQERRARA